MERGHVDTLLCLVYTRMTPPHRCETGSIRGAIMRSFRGLLALILDPLGERRDASDQFVRD